MFYVIHIYMIQVYYMLHGRWGDEDYSDGTAPWLWTGSFPIFDEYLKTGVKVRYAQCFVYAAVFTTGMKMEYF